MRTKKQQLPPIVAMESRFDMQIFLVFGSLLCAQLFIMVEEKLFLLGCPLLYQPLWELLPVFIDQPAGTHYL